MARYSAEHKSRSREALLKSAAELFRSKGYDGVGIDELCAHAGLTRGAFYGHFAAKAAVLSEVLKGAHDFLERLRRRRARNTRGLRRQAAEVARAYLAPANRTAVASGCSMSALAADVMRGDGEAQGAYAANIANLVEELRRGHDNDPLDADTARQVIALCVGGLLIDNACGGEGEGARVAKAAQSLVGRLLAS